MNTRPKTSGRPPTAATRTFVGVDGRPPPTGRTGTTMGTARPGSRANLTTGQGRGLSAQITVVDRPMTQQGLGGLKTAPQRNQRQVQDKSYFQGLIRTKVSELNNEIGRLMKEINHLTQEQSTYLTYDKRAKALAQEINDFQGQLGDYNMLVDKLNTDTEVEEVNREYQELKIQNEQESKMVDMIFANKREHEVHIEALEREIEQERNAAEILIASMKPEMRDKYLHLKQSNSVLQEQMEKLQQEMDGVNAKKVALEDEISMSQVKQEAVTLYEKIRELEEKRDSLLEEERTKGTPAQEQERLLKQVKEDNQEIATMERQTNEVIDKMAKLRDELQHVEQDLEENQNERSQKFRELKKRDETMTHFLDTFDDGKGVEIGRKTQLEQSVVEMLERTSRSLSHFHHMPAPHELTSLKDDLSFKEGEMEKSKSTAMSLAHEQQKVSMDLQKIEQLEEKIKDEMEVLEKKMRSMEDEMIVYSDLDKLKTSSDEKQRYLTEERTQLAKQRDYIKQALTELQDQYDHVRTQLNENETHMQLTNLERKWQHVEQTNFAMKEFIATKLAETDYKPISKVVFKQVSEYNQQLQRRISDNLLKR